MRLAIVFLLLAALLLAPVASAEAVPTPLTYRIDVRYEGAVFAGKVPAAAHPNGTLEASGKIRGYVEELKDGGRLTLRYNGTLLRDESGALALDEMLVAVSGEIWGTRVRHNAVERFRFTPPVRDVPTNWSAGHTWTANTTVALNRTIDGKEDLVSTWEQTVHFRVTGENLTVTVGGVNRTGLAVLMDFEPEDTDGRYWVAWIDPADGTLVGKARYKDGKEIARAILADADPAAPSKRGRIPAPDPLLLAVVASLAGALLGKRRIARYP